MNGIKLIGLTGRVGSGKSEVARLLSEDHGFHELMFKARLVHCLSEIFNIDSDVFYDRKKKELPNPRLFGKSPRQIMIAFGTDFGRNMVSHDIWVRNVEEDFLIEKFIGVDGVVISDVRYNNEAEMIKRNGGEIWLIERKDNPYANDTNHHKQEGVDAKYIDKVIVNNGTLENLFEIVSSELKNGHK